MKLTENFDLEEMTKSSTALRLGLKNEPNAQQIASLKLLCERILQPLRALVGPIVVNSGFRSAELNTANNGSKNSQHMKGEAADIEAINFDNLKLAKFIRNSFDFDQIILEFYDGIDPRSGWVHVSYTATGNRKQVLKASRLPTGKTVYSVAVL